MGARFRKRIRLGKFLYWNFHWSEKNGVTNSASVGQPGANVNVGVQDGKPAIKRGTIGIPGSGLRYDTSLLPVLNSGQDEPVSDEPAYREVPPSSLFKVTRLILSAGILFMLYRAIAPLFE